MLDPEARKALENLAKVKAARRDRDDAQDAKRRKMREELARRERAAERGKTEEEEAKEKLQAELARLRRDFATRKKAYDRESSVAGTHPGRRRRRERETARHTRCRSTCTAR